MFTLIKTATIKTKANHNLLEIDQVNQLKSFTKLLPN